ncbi:MAG: tetratricopeptide repeat protein [Rhodospirillales bacterium]|jgi:hypothetical protein|nr:tetratricopeptide repeat protein [Rhodospirillales bacterium]
MKRFLALVVLALAVGAAMLWNGETQDDPAKAEIQRFHVLQPLAEQGDADAQYDLAGLYRAGRGVEVDPRAAAEWYLKAAKKGHVAARHALGRMFETGQGVKRNFQKAAQWYGLAAGIGEHGEAQYDLGTLYYHGRGVPHDYAVAIKWYRKAALRGHTVAQFHMAP